MLKNCETGSIYYLRYDTLYEKPVFASSALSIQMVQILKYYQWFEYKERFSQAHSKFFVNDSQRSHRVSLLGYCLLPQSYHIVVRQEVPYGIYDYIRRVNEAIGRYYNVLFKQTGRAFAKSPHKLCIPEERVEDVLEQLYQLPLYSQINWKGGWRRYPWTSLHDSLKPF